MILRSVAVLCILIGLACASPVDPVSRVGENRLVGDAKDEFNRQVDEGKAFVIVGACDPDSDIRFVEFESGDQQIVGILANRVSNIFPVDPRFFRLNAAISKQGSGLIAFSRDLELAPGSVNYLGGIEEHKSSDGEVTYALVKCPQLRDELVQLYPYQIVRLPYYDVEPGR